MRDPIKLDSRDLKILRELQHDGRLSNVELADRVGMSASNCLRRVRALEEAGLIAGYTAIIDAKRAGYQLAVYIMVNVDQRVETDARSFLEAVAADDRIVECSVVTGDHDFLLKAVVEDIDSLTNLTMERLLKLPSVTGLTSCLILKSFKQLGSFKL